MQEELYPPSAPRAAREELDDARLVDLDVAEESPFLRGQKRVSARRSSLPKKTASRLLWVSIAAGDFVRGRYRCRGSISLWRTLVAIPHRVERRHRRHRHAERHQGANHGSHGRRHRAQYFLCPADPAESATRTDPMGRVGQRDALRPQPPEGRNSRAYSGGLCPRRPANFR